MNSKSSSLQRILISILAYAIMPNVIFWIVSFALNINRGVFNIDYLFAGILFVVGLKRVGAIALALFIVVDTLATGGLVFPFVRVQDVFYLLSFIPYAALEWKITAAALSVSIIFVFVFIIIISTRAGKLSTLVIFNISILCYGLKVYSADLENEKYYRSAGGLFASQSVFFADTRTTGFISSFLLSENKLTNIGFVGATSVWAKKKQEDLGGKLFLVIAESWGIPKNKAIHDKIISPLTSLQSTKLEWLKIDEAVGAQATVLGELKELCGTTVDNFNIKILGSGFEGCLPNALRSAGYTTEAIHGAPGIMYDRIHWYPRAGFEKLTFNESRSWGSRCYSYPGVCDAEIIADYIPDLFAGTDKTFVYWLTLNTHAVYDRRDIKVDLFDCQEFNIDVSSETCRMNKLHAQFFHNLAEILVAPQMQGVEVIIVGDHAPRILNKDEFEQHIEESLVGSVHLKVK